MDNLISIVIPVYNIGELLNPCLDSLLNQTYRRLDIWLIDDGSTPATAAICDQWGEADSRISVVHKANGGVSSARNEGIRRAKGDYIMFVDGDDWLDLDGVQKMTERIEITHADVCFCNKYYKNELKVQTSTNLSTDSTLNAIDVIKHHMHYGFVVSPCLALARIDRIRDVFFSEQVHTLEDWEYNFRMLSRMEKVAICDQPYYHYRTVEGSASVSPLNAKKMTCFNIPQLVNQYIETNKLDLEEEAKYVPIFLLYHMLVCYSVHGCATDEDKQLRKIARRMLCYSLTSSRVDYKHKLYVALASISPNCFKVLYNFKNKR